jgi:ribosomal protein S18 acetylase RimI-like enzyme
MHIRQIHIDEAYLVIELFDRYRVFYKQPSDLQLAKAFITERLVNNESVIFVVLDEEVAVGFTQLYPKYSSARAVKNWILNDLFVEPTHRKKGFGAALIDAATTYSKSNGAKFVQLETAVDNYTARELYKAVGFVEHEADKEFLLFKKIL